MSNLDQVKDILGDLIAYPTVSSDSNLQMIDYLSESLTKSGAKVDVFHDSSGKKANLFATIGEGKENGIVLSGHTDVVPVTDQNWSSDPFEMVERDGRIYGRGTCDMKGFIAAAISFAPIFAELNLARPIHFAFTHDEETGCIGAQQLVQDLKRNEVRPSMAIIGEPTEMRIIEGHKGCCECTATFVGLEGHGSRPELGVNAVEYATRYATHLLSLRKDLVERCPENSRFEPPYSTINLGSIRGGTVHNVIASKCDVLWEMRTVQSSDLDYVQSAMEDYTYNHLEPEMKARFPDASIETEIHGDVAGFEPMEDNEAKRFFSELTGANGADVVSFGTEAGLFQTLGLSAVVCGPGSIEQAHKADEYISLDQLQSCINMLEKLTTRVV